MATSFRSLQIGPLRVDAVTQQQAIDYIDELVASGEGGSVFTPNVDHVVLADSNRALAEAYGRVSLSLADGFPIVVTSKFTRVPLPEKVSGSDLIEPLMASAAQKGRRVFLFGGFNGAGEEAARVLQKRYPTLQIVGTASPQVDPNASDEALMQWIEPVRAAKAEYVLVALGAPKQELFIDRVASKLKPAVWLGIGASLDFIAGRVRRAPPWMSRIGLEWWFRLNQERGRLWRRYLRDTAYPVIVLKHHLTARRGGV